MIVYNYKARAKVFVSVELFLCLDETEVRFSLPISTEFGYNDVFLLWETVWAAKQCCSTHFLEFCGLAIMQQFK